MRWWRGRKGVGAGLKGVIGLSGSRWYILQWYRLSKKSRLHSLSLISSSLFTCFHTPIIFCMFRISATPFRAPHSRGTALSTIKVEQLRTIVGEVWYCGYVCTSRVWCVECEGFWKGDSGVFDLVLRILYMGRLGWE